MTKTEIKKAIKEELQCPTDFIERCLNAEGRIDEMKDAIEEHTQQMVMNTIYEEWKDYCEAWGLNPQEDNTKFKPALINH